VNVRGEPPYEPPWKNRRVNAVENRRVNVSGEPRVNVCGRTFVGTDVENRRVNVRERTVV
jgi:hypothetical protein